MQLLARCCQFGLCESLQHQSNIAVSVLLLNRVLCVCVEESIDELPAVAPSLLDVVTDKAISTSKDEVVDESPADQYQRLVIDPDLGEWSSDN